MGEKFFQGNHHENNDDGHKNGNSDTIPEQLQRCGALGKPAIPQRVYQQDGFYNQDAPENPHQKYFTYAFIFVFLSTVHDGTPLMG